MSAEYIETLETLIEAILLIESDGVQFDELKRLTKTGKKEIDSCLDSLEKRLTGGIQLVRTSSNCYLTTADSVQSRLKDIYKEQPVRFSVAALETLAIVAYTQPVTKASIEQVRGVSCNYLLKRLLNDGYVKKAGKKDVPGRPNLFATTQKFLVRFSLRSLDDLPPLAKQELNFLSKTTSDGHSGQE